MMQDFERMKAECEWQKISFEVCDECHIDPLECGSRYGNRRKCHVLMEKLEEIFEYLKVEVVE